MDINIRRIKGQCDKDRTGQKHFPHLILGFIANNGGNQYVTVIDYKGDTYPNGQYYKSSAMNICLSP